MIRINLLGLPKPKKGKRAAAAMGGGGGGPSIFILLAIFGLLAIGGNYYYYNQLQNEAKQLAQKTLEAQRENARLGEVKKAFLELEKQKDQYEHRVQVISQLQQNRSGPQQLLTSIANTVNSTDAVWLNSMKEDGNNVNLDGVALSIDAVARLMENLKKSGYFRNVEIKESYQDDVVKDMQAFVFTLVCEKVPPAPQKS